MTLPDWRNLALNEGILSEPTSDDQRVVLWLPGRREGAGREWERISSVARGPISGEKAFRTVAATAFRCRQVTRSFLGKLFRPFQKPGDRTWTLPNGACAEQIEDRRHDLLLVWSENSDLLDDAGIQARWPECKGIQKLGQNLFLVSGIEPPPSKSEAAPQPAAAPPECPTKLAEQLLAAARRAGDRRSEASALTDLGILLAGQGNAQRAVALLEEALTLVRQLGDRALESDVLDNLGLAVLSAGQPRRALELFQHSLGEARAAGDQFAEKMRLFHLGLAYSAARDFPPAFAFFEQALVIARQVGDRHHEADLLWQLGIVHAEAGQRDQAVAKGQEAVDLFQQMTHPQADWLASQLQKYRAGETGGPLGGVDPAKQPGGFFGGQIVASGWADSGAWLGQTPGTSGPGLLRMAFSAMKSMARFAGSGFKPTPTRAYQNRLQTCRECQHHTGLRCKLCGCFTSVKAWMPHESCPIGKWPR